MQALARRPLGQILRWSEMSWCGQYYRPRRAQEPTQKWSIKLEQQALPHYVAMPRDDALYGARQRGNAKVSHRIGGELEMDNVERCSPVQAQCVQRHARADRGAAHMDERARIHRLARRIGIRRQSTRCHDVVQFSLSSQPKS